ncbi:unnamed protein product [Heterobilharzia americana]|nr:unnamed protein product [Heterobilharzia americana]
MISQFEKLHRKESLRKLKNLPERSELPTGLKILEALAASGIRSVRFALEVPNVSCVTANDLSPDAVILIGKNAAHNNVSSVVHAVCNDAIDLMYTHRTCSERFNVVDIDPFGSASPFLDSAVQCLHNGGLLCVTSTDMAVLCGSTPGTSMSKYGGLAIKTGSTHEVALRILLNAMQSAASRYGKVIEPLLSLSVDFYARVFVRVWHSPISVKAIAAKHGICFMCPGCHAYHIQPLGIAVNSPKAITPAHGPPIGPQCAECGSKFRVFGPMWIGPLHNRPFLREFLSDLGCPPKVIDGDSNHFNPGSYSPLVTKNTIQNSPEISSESTVQCEPLVSKNYGTLKRIIGMVTVAYEELPDVPLYYELDQLASAYGCTLPKLLDLHSCLLNANYRVSCSHADKKSLKTDAPHSFVLDCFRAHYERQNPTQKGDGEENSKEETKASEKITVREKRRLKRKRHANKNICDSPDEEDNDSEPENVPNHQVVRANLLVRPINPLVSFTRHPLANPPSRDDGLLRYQLNPEKHWGPKSRPKMKNKSQ